MRRAVSARHRRFSLSLSLHAPISGLLFSTGSWPLRAHIIPNIFIAVLNVIFRAEPLNLSCGVFVESTCLLTSRICPFRIDLINLFSIGCALSLNQIAELKPVRLEALIHFLFVSIGRIKLKLVKLTCLLQPEVSAFLIVENLLCSRLLNGVRILMLNYFDCVSSRWLLIGLGHYRG